MSPGATGCAPNSDSKPAWTAFLCSWHLQDHALRVATCSMDRVGLHGRLEQTERNVAEAKRHIARLRELLAEFQRGGNDIRLAMNLLGQFEQRLATYIGDRDRLRNELGLPAWCP